jgi:hypothetical protein
MPILPTKLDYTDKDEASLRLRLQKLVKSVYPSWTDFSTANFGNILLELFAHVGGITTFYMDQQAGESRWSTAQLRKNILALVKLINYQPRTATSSRCDLTLTLAATPAGDVTFDAGDMFSTEGKTIVKFELLEAATIVAGANPPTVTVTVANRQTRLELFASTGLANQEVVLSATPFLSEDIAVTDASGAWTLVADFSDSGPLDRHFTATIDHNQRATLRFGTGTVGALAQGSISVTYYTGGGSTGNVEAGTVTRVGRNYVDSLGNPVIVSCTNVSAALPAVDEETVAEIRENAPRSLRVLNRTVAREDYEINALRVPGVSRALMLTRNEDPGIAENAGILYIVPDGAGLPTLELKNAVSDMVTITYPKTITFSLTVSDPVYLTVVIRARVYLQQGFTNAVVKANILAALAAFFALDNPDGTMNTAIDFGFNYKDAAGEPTNELALSTLMKVVEECAGVRKLDDSTSGFLVNLKHQDLAIGVRALPRLGQVILINGDTGVTM